MTADPPRFSAPDRSGRGLRGVLGPGSRTLRRSAARLIGRPGPAEETDHPGPVSASAAEPTVVSAPADSPGPGGGWTLDPPVDGGLMLFESFEGHGALCSPLTIFRHVVQRADFAAFRFAWSLQDEAAVDQARTDLAPWLPRVELVVRDSDRYRQLLGQARFLVNNHGFPSYFAKQPGQLYVNTWHGMPLKKMGFDLHNGHLTARSTLRNFLSADVLVSSGPAMTARLYDGAYRLRDLHVGRILEIGTPRVDDQLCVAGDTEPVRDRLRAAGVAVEDDHRVVLLAPTWKGRSYRHPSEETAQLARRVEQLGGRLGPSYRILLKVHQRTYDHAAAHAPLRDCLVPNDLPANAVLGLTDVLVTDYSSILVDFLATGRPIVLHRPDLASYDSYRGLYPEPDLPGPQTRTTDELADTIRAVGTGGPADPSVSHAEPYRRWASAYAPYEDGQATRRLVDAVFADADADADADAPGTVDPRRQRPAKTRLLIYLGGLLPNGITTAALALLRELDYTRFSVVAHFEHQRDQQDWARVAEIPPEVVQLIRTGPLVAPEADKAALDAYLDRTDLSPEVRRRALVTLDYEWRRCFGTCEFDHVVDFSGYSALWAAKLSRSPTGRRAIWLHNDLGAEVANPAKRHAAAMPRLFAQYPGYDALVSVSPELAVLNRERLATPDTRERFGYARNAVDADRIRRLAFGPEVEADSTGGTPGVTHGWKGLSDLVTAYGPRTVRAEVARLELAQRVAGLTAGTTFVTIGRLSPEKNHERLLGAFAVLHALEPDTRLLIVGDGDLRERLQDQVRRLDLDDAVVLMGHLANPYVVLAAADCFVLSSDYEGLPMALLEARVLDVPVLSTRFATVESAVPPGTGLVVDLTVEALATGLRAAVQRQIPHAPFDVAAWNVAAVAEFCAVLGVADETAPADEAHEARDPTRERKTRR